MLFYVLVFAKPLCALSVAPSTVEVNSCILCLHILYMCSSRRLALENIEMLPRVVQVHRGVYVAAEILYERFKPMVEEQLASSPFAKIAFTVSHSQCSKLASLILQDKTVFTSCSNHKHVVGMLHQLVHTSCTAIQNVCTLSGISPHAVSALLATYINLALKNSPTTKEYTACSASWPPRAAA